MKKLALGAIFACALLPACGKKKVQTVVIKHEDLEVERVSGPLSDKNIDWAEEDMH